MALRRAVPCRVLITYWSYSEMLLLYNLPNPHQSTLIPTNPHYEHKANRFRLFCRFRVCFAHFTFVLQVSRLFQQFESFNVNRTKYKLPLHPPVFSESRTEDDDVLEDVEYVE